MGRGTQGQVQQQGNALLNAEGQNTATNQDNAQAAQSFLMPAYQGMYNNPGLTPTQKQSETAATEQGTGAAFGAASQEATNRAARTNNAAGLTATQDALARDRMRTAAEQETTTAANNVNAERADQRTALSGIQGLYGTATGAANAGYGAQNSTLGTLSANAARQKQGGFWNDFMDSSGNALGKTLFGG